MQRSIGVATAIAPSPTRKLSTDSDLIPPSPDTPSQEPPMRTASFHPRTLGFIALSLIGWLSLATAARAQDNPPRGGPGGRGRPAGFGPGMILATPRAAARTEVDP